MASCQMRFEPKPAGKAHFWAVERNPVAELPLKKESGQHGLEAAGIWKLTHVAELIASSPRE